MDTENAIEQLEFAIDLIKQNGKDWLDERDIPMLEKAIEALQKCNLKKRKKITDGFAKCQHCHKYIRLPIIEYYICCPECGRQLDWSGG